MARVTADEVKEILDTAINLGAFIQAANLLVTDVLGGTSLSADRLKEIERWLTAHLACARDPRSRSVKIGMSATQFEGKSGLGLDATSYGQQVRLLDTTGSLARLGMKRARIVVAEQTSDAETSEDE